MNYMRKYSLRQRQQMQRGSRVIVQPPAIYSNVLNMKLSHNQFETISYSKNKYNPFEYEKINISPRKLPPNRYYSFTNKKQDQSSNKYKQQLVSQIKKKGLNLSIEFDQHHGQIIKVKKSLWVDQKQEKKRRDVPLAQKINFINQEKHQKIYLDIKKEKYNHKVIDLVTKNIQNQKKYQQKNDYFEYVMRFSYRTKKGYLPNNPQKVNQDSYILNPNIKKKSYQHYFGVCDGHGVYGHFVSSFIKNTLPNLIENTQNIQKNPRQALEKCFYTTYQKLMTQSKIDMKLSGSTINCCYLLQNKVYCINVGDSRAILGRKTLHGKWKAQALSTDHKPQMQHQANRIKSLNGRIQKIKDANGEGVGPLRVWLKNENMPGLAMSRSFGDLIAASVGVSPLPQIKQYTLNEQDKILLIGSDGLFQFIQNQQIVQMLVPYYQNKDIQQACDFLMAKAHQSWVNNSSIVDDITFIMIFLHYSQIV